MTQTKYDLDQMVRPIYDYESHQIMLFGNYYCSLYDRLVLPVFPQTESVEALAIRGDLCLI